MSRRINELSLSSELGPLINRLVLVSPNLPPEYHLYLCFKHLILYFILDRAVLWAASSRLSLSAFHHDESSTLLVRLIANWKVPLATPHRKHLSPAQDTAAKSPSYGLRSGYHKATAGKKNQFLKSFRQVRP